MHAWDYDRTTLEKGEDAELWRLERLILYGLGGEKLDAGLLRKHWNKLRIPEERRLFLKLLLS